MAQNQSQSPWHIHRPTWSRSKTSEAVLRSNWQAPTADDPAYQLVQVSVGERTCLVCGETFVRHCPRCSQRRWSHPADPGDPADPAEPVVDDTELSEQDVATRSVPTISYLLPEEYRIVR